MSRLSLQRRRALAWLIAARLALSATLAAAQSKPFELNMDRVKVSGNGGLGSFKTVILPSVNLYITAHGDIWAQSRGLFSSNAQAHAKYFVRGLDKALAQGLAQRLQDDLITKLRGAGYTVLTYDDIKADADVAGRALNKPDAKLGLPTKGGENVDYIIATPTDAQAFDNPITGGAFWLRGVARERQAIVIVPEIYYSVPQVGADATSAGRRSEASINFNPAMRLDKAFIWGINGKQEVGNIQVLQHGMRLAADNAGTLAQLTEDTYNFSSSWSRTSADYVFTLDVPAFSDGVMRVGVAINTMIVEQMVKAAR